MKLTINESATYRSGSATVTVKAQPLEINVDAADLAKKQAERGKEQIAADIRGISEQASPGTVAQRRRKGIGSTKLFNATGRLVSGLQVTKDAGGFSVVAPSDRLQDDEVLARLLEHLSEPEMKPEDFDMVKVKR